METSTSLGSFQKFEGTAGEFKGVLGSRRHLISSPATRLPDYIYIQSNLVKGNVKSGLLKRWSHKKGSGI